MTEQSQVAMPTPNAALHQLGVGHWVAQALYAVAKLGVADILGEGACDVDDIAQRIGAHAGALYRLLRALASVGVFTETEPRRFGLTPIGTLLRRDTPGSLHPLIILTGEMDWKPWEHILHSVRTGETAAEYVYGINIFAQMQKDPEMLAAFGTAMTSFVTQTAQAVCAAYDFSPFGTIVDVGGGFGLLLTSILEATPAAKGILADLPSVAEAARQTVARAGLESRCECIGGDFFAGVPKGGDAYVLSSIIHDWDEERALAILRNCREAMSPSGRLLLVEMVIPPGDVPFPGKLLDLEMLVVFGGRERTELEYRDLLKAAGFVVERVVPTSAPASVIEARSV
jgi:predicted O-methyltransferase YrrM